jgi:hypothetical protein
MRKKLYISAFALDLDDRKGVPQRGLDFVEALRNAGYEAYMPLEWREYPVIESEIDECDGLVALVDEYWLSSTWKLSEVTYALNGVGVLRVNKADKPKPTFIFWNNGSIEVPWPVGEEPPVRLSEDIETAISIINARFTDYDEDKVLDDYVWWNYMQFFTTPEKLGAKGLRAEFKAGAAEDTSPKIAKMLRKHWGAESGSEAASALAEGQDAYKRRVRERVMRDHADDIVVNRCPACDRIVKTPRAKQCLWCGHDWH